MSSVFDCLGAAESSRAVSGDFMFYSRVERHSISPDNYELVSFVVTYPRSILPEFNTHTIVSKNTSSSRAIPYRRQGIRKPNAAMSMREMVLECPYLPLYWGRNEAGMQASTELTALEIKACKSRILDLRDSAVAQCDALWDLGMHKQDINRYLEPWAWTTQILTSCQWSNFFALRTHKDAHPAFRKIARQMYLQYIKSVPTKLDYGQWHLPFTDDSDYNTHRMEDLKKISVARCARISYNNFDGTRNVARDFDLFEKLSSAVPKHLSPFGHQGTPQRLLCWSGNFFGWNQYRKEIAGENVLVFSPTEAELASWIGE